MAPDQHDTPPPRASAAGRIVVIDVLRGLAILWVMTFHLWIDMTGGRFGVSPLWEDLGNRIAEARPLAALTALGELILGSGYQGVAVFMMLSGLSLVMHAELRPARPAWHGMTARLRRMVTAYWAGVLFYCAIFAAVALLQYWLDGGSLRSQLDHVRIGGAIPVRIGFDDIAWALSIFGPLVRGQYGTSPVASLWFVPLLLQYYLLFPLLLPILRRAGPWWFALAAVALTVGARAAYADFSPGSIEAYDRRTLDYFAPFRGSEFLFGMSLGWLFAHQRQRVAAWVESPLDIAGVLAIAGLMQWASVSIAATSTEGDALLIVAGQASLVLFTLPLLFKTPGRFETSAVAGALVSLGVISFTALNVNDAMRLVASFVRDRELQGVLWWTFVVAVYIPLATAAVAWPMAWALRLLPSQRPRREPPAAPAPSVAAPPRGLADTSTT